jgi:hypothetical protein
MTLGSLVVALWCRLPQHLRLVFWCAMYWIDRRLYGKRDLRPQQLPLGLCFESLPEGAREAVMMRFVSSNTSIPMPMVVDFVPGNELTSGGEDYLILTTISVTHPRLTRYTQPQWDSLGKQIRSCVDLLRAFPAPWPEICTFGGRRYNNLRLGWNPTGPFADLNAFNAHLLSLVPPRVRENPKVTPTLAKWRRIVFSHSDLSPRNVLVDSWGRLVGILDWEMTGWFLEYWEHTAALAVDRYTQGDVRGVRARATGWVHLVHECDPRINPPSQDATPRPSRPTYPPNSSSMIYRPSGGSLFQIGAGKQRTLPLVV